jgi:hypothetical protein
VRRRLEQEYLATAEKGRLKTNVYDIDFVEELEDLLPCFDESM